ncbi:MAG: DUF1178 family protein [Pseudomonadota bacterium]
MIKYALKCDQGHSFDSWFASADGYETLRAAGHVSCVICGSSEVSKAIMAPRVNVPAKSAKAAPAPEAKTAEDLQKTLTKMREEVEKNATYVGGNFAKEARAQYLGDVPDRPIWGEAKPEEAKSLIEDGVPVAPLPFVPSRKAN